MPRRWPLPAPSAPLWGGVDSCEPSLTRTCSGTSCGTAGRSSSQSAGQRRCGGTCRSPPPTPPDPHGPADAGYARMALVFREWFRRGGRFRYGVTTGLFFGICMSAGFYWLGSPRSAVGAGIGGVVAGAAFRTAMAVSSQAGGLLSVSGLSELPPSRSRARSHDEGSDWCAGGLFGHLRLRPAEPANLHAGLGRGSRPRRPLMHDERSLGVPTRAQCGGWNLPRRSPVSHVRDG